MPWISRSLVLVHSSDSYSCMCEWGPLTLGYELTWVCDLTGGNCVCRSVKVQLSAGPGDHVLINGTDRRTDAGREWRCSGRSQWAAPHLLVVRSSTCSLWTSTGLAVSAREFEECVTRPWPSSGRNDADRNYEV